MSPRQALTGPALCRLNSAPVKGFEKDVGSKTTLRITYPEGAMQRPEQYERDSLFVLAGFKWQDFKWLKYIVYKERVVSSLYTSSFPSCPGLSQLPSQPFPLNPVKNKEEAFKRSVNNQKLKDTQTQPRDIEAKGDWPKLLELIFLISAICLQIPRLQVLSQPSLATPQPRP